MNDIKRKIVKLLLWSQKYTKTDMRYIAHGAFWSVIGQISAIFCTFILAMVVSRYLPKEIYGQYKYVLSIIGILSTFSLTGIGTAVFQSTSKGFDGALRDGFFMNLKWSIFIFFGALFLGGYYYINDNLSLAISILIGGSLTPFLTSASLSNSFLGAKKDFARQTIYFDVIENIIPITLLIVTILLSSNPTIIVAVYFISNTFVSLHLYHKTLCVYKPDSNNKDNGMLAYAKHLSFMGILGSIANNIDQILLFHFGGAVQLAIYNFAIALPNQFKSPFKMLDSMIQTRFASHSDREIHRSLHNKMLWLFLSSLILIIGYVVVAPYIFRIFFPLYTDAVLYSQIYMLSWLSVAFVPSTSYLVVKKKLKGLYISTLVGYTFQILAMLYGVINWGLGGLIGARIVVKIGGGVLNYILSRLT